MARRASWFWVADVPGVAIAALLALGLAVSCGGGGGEGDGPSLPPVAVPDPIAAPPPSVPQPPPVVVAPCNRELLFACDLAGNPRESPPTMGALAVAPEDR